MKKVYKPSLLHYNKSFIENKAVVVENGKILAVDSVDELIKKYNDAEIVDLTGTIMVPGTVNIHNHSFQSLLRGIAADKPFLEWRDKSLYKFSPELSADDIYTGALFAFGEMLKYGVTTVSDFFYVHNDGIESDEAVIKAAKDVGIRLVLARTMYDWDGAPKGYLETVDEAYSNVEKLAVKYNTSDTVKIVPAPHSLHAASIDMIKAGYKLAKELETKFHIHVAEEPFEVDQVKKEFNLRPMELLNKIGVVDDSMLAIHCVWLNDNEIKIMGENKANLAYCPSSNMFLADGVTNIPALIKAGVKIGFGTDGACSNNRISVFEEMRMCSLLQKVTKLDSLCVNYNDVFSMGTEYGGEILQMNVGKIEKGYGADFVAIDMNDMSMQPIFKSGEQILPNIVYSMQPCAIKYVISNGEIKVKDGHILTISEDKIVNNVQKLMEKLENV
ncbi:MULTISPECIES: amidohydrolase family protein [Clostridium]|uniref:amidohydrolase family protein n=1 Tax=Clostridium TaxID=1485 RepID=UPI000826D7FF|nr:MULTISPECIES: amidohydrolase [Clostridium]PJI08838.1 S-adenosylhomocysteine deaminase [Clostridium sp. CT7]